MSTGRRLVQAGTLVALGLAAHTAWNLRQLRRPQSPSSPVTERVSMLVPARNEQAHVETTVRTLLDQQHLEDAEVIVLDDGSTDGTHEILESIRDPRLTVITAPDVDPPSGWLGKPWACMRLAEQATGRVLVFTDADVWFEPDAVAAAVSELRDGGFALVSPYPRQDAQTWLERLVQPLVVWSWAATMPLGWAERSTRRSLSAANGQFIVVDADAYRSIGGHAAVRDLVLEDIGLMRAVKSSGRRAATADGSRLAHCRMYASPTELVDGYAKSLWAAFNGPAGSLAVNGLLVLAYVVPAAGLLARHRPTRAIAIVGVAAGITSRALVAAHTGTRTWPDAAAHPASVVAFGALNAISWWRHLRGANTWKGRPVRGAAA